MHAHNHHHRYQETKKATLYGALKNIFLAVLKVVLGITGNSHALLADGIHSFSDLLTDVLVLFASHWGAQEADVNHPYGHQRIETAASMLLALFLIIAGLAIGYDAGMHLLGNMPHEKPDFYVLIVALASVLLNEIVFQYTSHKGKKIKSDLLLANAWHHRSDAASSLVVLVGVAGALIGYYELDPLAACIVGIMIIKMGAVLAWTSISELVDTGVDENELDKIAAVISKTTGVRAIHQLRTRSMGGAIFVDVHILVNPKLSVSEGHYIAEQVHANLKKSAENVKDVIVHVDSEDDTTVFESLALPSRKQVFEMLKEYSNLDWERSSSKTVLHYLEGEIFLEVFLDEEMQMIEAEKVQMVLNKVPVLKKISIFREKTSIKFNKEVNRKNDNKKNDTIT